MTIRQKIEKLVREKANPCVSISLNTHRTHPANASDGLQLKNLFKEAEKRLLKEFSAKEIAPLLENLSKVESETDMNYNLDSMHIFLSNNTREIIKSSWNVNEHSVQISDMFSVRSLIKEYNRSEEYLILLLSQGGVQLYEALNDGITREIENEDFPFPQSTHYTTSAAQGADAGHVDNLIREYINKVDKALVNVYNQSGLKCVAICTEDNYSKLMQVADRPEVYYGFDHVDYNKTEKHHIVSQAWEIVSKKQKQSRSAAISEIKEAVSRGAVLTDLQEIYQAAIDGRGDLLVAHGEFSQAVKMTGERTFNLSASAGQSDVIDDISSKIAWEVLSKKGRVIFTSQEEIKDIGNIALKTRY